ncbi:PEGA domain-containing protein [Pseudodesulfovibrio sp. zrk46]|uniref:PEGA domain-containing protein n=1 Tax=Pseudodesulfovibrio sp. zrk46 TaxID=2725288 RepID=UPI001448E4A2|nr:PEGA domain-containing protein [Pseudodesulfovibrio sp. zrk46]QJB56978.1 PEGA domain-containing protein [Pseudodesulfovibrio sp. zrk46]
MKKEILSCAAALLLASSLAACKAATQTIPVSTNPTGAVVYADGTETCISPCNVELEKTQPHILTFKKDGYRQADVQISRQYDTGAVARDAVQSAVSVKDMGATDEGAFSNALLSTQAAESDGSAYVLTPASVVVDMVPAGQTARPVAVAPKPIQTAQQGDAPIVISSDQLDAADQQKLKQQEAQAPADQQPIVISSDQLAPEDRKAVVHTTQPATMQRSAEENPEKALEGLLEAGAAAAPTVGTEKNFETSHHDSSSFDQKTGTYSESHSSTHVGVGVHVNPAEAGLGILHLLEDANKKSDGEATE